MVDTHNLHPLDDWEGLSLLPSAVQHQLSKQVKNIILEPGEQLHSFDHLPPGLLFLKKGQMRLLGMNQYQEPFTLDRYNAGDLAGAELLLRGVPGLCLAASTHLEGLLLPTESFLHAIQAEPHLIQAFKRLKASELYAAVEFRKDPLSPTADDLLLWAQEECRLPKEVLILTPGKHELNSNWGRWIVSSGNIQGETPGSVLQGPLDITILGRLPGRLLPIPPHWPPQRTPAGSPEKKLESFELTPYTSNPQYQREALEDWYGRLRDDGTFPQLNGNGPLEEALACLRMLSRHFDLPFRRDVLRRVLRDQLDRSTQKRLGMQQLAAICDLLGLRSTPLQPSATQQLERLPLPALCVLNGHPVVFWQQKSNQLLIGDPLRGQKWVSCDELLHQNQSEVLPLLYLEASASTPKPRFGLSWFIPAIRKHRNSLIQVVVASFFVQLLGLFNPLLIQQIIDAVISQGNFASLNVLGTLLVAMALTQALMGAMRTYLFSDTTNRIDISLGATIIHHLLRLPLSYFAKRPVGEVSSRISELEKIRRFLTGTALTVLLDAVFSVIYIGVMLLYSVQLTFWALAVLPLFVALTMGVAPVIRRQLRLQAEANARVQSHLVETLSGMETVKCQGMELPSEWRWEQLYGGQIQAGFRNTVTSTAAGSASQFLEQVSGLLVIWMGATLVLKGQLTLGQLIAFRILSGYVTSPLLRLASLWQNFQATALSLERLSDIVDHREEIEIAGENQPPLPPIQGAITYEGVNFRFTSSGALQLLNVTFEIKPGEFVGIVGSSGSGKSTLLKLLTRLFDPLEGTIRVDGYDISKVDLYSLRSQIGVVPQDSLLFDGSVQANIALTRPDATFEEICDAAQVACAHDFIQALPAGYSSSVGERGATLSGGQRQRMAIARMVLKRPRLLVMDEATSALDVNTERQVTRNLTDVYRGSTVLFITHRLSSLRHADRILVMHQGALAEQGTHSELMALAGRYATLYQQQEGGLE